MKKQKDTAHAKGGKAVLKKYGRKHFSDMKKAYWKDVKRKLAHFEGVDK